MAGNSKKNTTRFDRSGLAQKFNLPGLDFNNPLSLGQLNPTEIADHMAEYQRARNWDGGIQQRASNLVTRASNLEDAVDRSSVYATDESINNAARAIDHQSVSSGQDPDIMAEMIDSLSMDDDPIVGHLAAGGNTLNRGISAVLPSPVLSEVVIAQEPAPRNERVSLQGISAGSQVVAAELFELDDPFNNASNVGAEGSKADDPVNPIEEEDDDPIVEFNNRMGILVDKGLATAQVEQTPPVSPSPSYKRALEEDAQYNRTLALFEIMAIGLTGVLDALYDSNRAKFRTPVNVGLVTQKINQVRDDVANIISAGNRATPSGAINPRVLPYVDLGLGLVQTVSGMLMEASQNVSATRVRLENLESGLTQVQNTVDNNLQVLITKLDKLDNTHDIRTQMLQSIITKLEKETMSVANLQYIVNGALETHRLGVHNAMPKMDIPSVASQQKTFPTEAAVPPNSIPVRHQFGETSPHRLALECERAIMGSVNHSIAQLAEKLPFDAEKMLKIAEHMQSKIKASYWTLSNLTMMCLPFYNATRKLAPKLYDLYPDVYNMTTAAKYDALAECLNNTPTIQTNVSVNRIPPAAPVRQSSSTQSLNTFHAKPLTRRRKM